MEMSKKTRARKKVKQKIGFEVHVKRMRVSQTHRGRKKELVRGGII